jgi:hypothetical protein
LTAAGVQWTKAALAVLICRNDDGGGPAAGIAAAATGFRLKGKPNLYWNGRHRRGSRRDNPQAKMSPLKRNDAD